MTMEPSLQLLSNKPSTIEKVQPGACASLSWQLSTNKRKIAAGFGDGKSMQSNDILLANILVVQKYCRLDLTVRFFRKFRKNLL